MIKLLLPASEIPLGSTVTKKTGEKQYILQKEIKVYGDTLIYSTKFPTTKCPDPTVCARAGEVFLIATNTGSAGTFEATKALVWHASDEQAEAFCTIQEAKELLAKPLGKRFLALGFKRTDSYWEA